MREVLVVLLLLIIVYIQLINYTPPSPPGPPGPPSPPGPPEPPGVSTAEINAVRGYLNALYPMAKGSLTNLDDTDVIKFYDSLDWYYLPLVRDIPKERKELKGPYTDAETQWFMADGADCGTAVTKPGTFTCSVFGGSCDSWEFGKSGSGGRPYQNICMIKPYGRRNGVPNNAYIECVAFVCEGLGKMLLNAPKCGTTAPPIKESFTAINCPIKTECSGKDASGTVQNDDPGCKVGTAGQEDICCWNYSTNKVDNSVCQWPTNCAAIQDSPNGPVFNNYCAVPCGYSNCDVTSGNCDWFINNESWIDYIKKLGNVSDYTQAVKITRDLQNSKPVLNGSQPAPRADVSLKDTMFYWCKGYGKFLNMGKTGTYFNYFHFLLTMPKFDSTGKIPIRWSFPQILQTATMAGGNTELYNQLNILISGEYAKGKKVYDKRQYLEGYVTTLISHQGDGGIQVANETNGINKVVNPLDDDNLIMVDKMTITKYYDPDSKIKNPQYNKPIKFTPLEAVMLLQGMHIYGATGNSTERPFVTMTPGLPWTSNSGTYPFGVFFDGANLGHCVYQSIKLCGWDSAQFTQMPTGAGGKKYCNYPEYDFEIVYIQDKQEVCESGFKLLDPIVEYDDFVTNGYLLPNENLEIVPLDASILKLSERNVPSTWTGPFPNTIAYNIDKNYQYYTDVSKCPYKDEVYSKYSGNKPNIPYK
jgi:hypothetical protein